MTAAHTPIFWRDSRMPHIELRKVADGRKVCYDLHSHTHWPLGTSTFFTVMIAIMWKKAIWY